MKHRTKINRQRQWRSQVARILEEAGPTFNQNVVGVSRAGGILQQWPGRSRHTSRAYREHMKKASRDVLHVFFPELKT